MKTIRGRFRAAVLMGAAASMLAFAAGAKAQNPNSNDNPSPQDNHVALRNNGPLARACGGWRRRLPARRDRADWREGG